MNLNSRDKLILVVVLVIVLWVAGIVTFIKPAIDDVKSAQNTLDEKEVELAEKKQQIEEDKDLPERIDAAYKEANETAEIFYPKMTHQHDAATEMQNQLDIDSNKDNGQEITNYNLEISALSNANLNKYVYTAQEVSSTFDTIVASMDEAVEQAQANTDFPILSGYSFSMNFTATKKDLLTFLDNLQSNPHKSLVVNSLAITSVLDNKDEDEWSGSMELMLYMVPRLKDPAIVNQSIDDGAEVNAVDDIAE